MSNNLRIADEITNLPDHFHDTFSVDFLTLLAALRLCGFAVLRADEAQEIVGANDDLWPELSHPSVLIQSKSAAKITDELRAAQPGSQEHTDLSNRLIRANLILQRELLDSLEDFYADRNVSFYARLIVETIDLGESYLRPQGASVRLIANESDQHKWFKEGNTEMLAFGEYLAEKL